jgi:hypothetical protein
MPESEHPFDVPEMWMQVALNALAAHIAVLDAQGTIVAVNAAWKEFGRARGAQPAVWGGIGLNYLDVCRRARRFACWKPSPYDLGLRMALHGASRGASDVWASRLCCTLNRALGRMALR